MNNRNCGRCHTCGGPLRACLDGEIWCPRCQQYRRYVSHGWSWQSTDRDERAQECPRREGG